LATVWRWVALEHLTTGAVLAFGYRERLMLATTCHRGVVTKVNSAQIIVVTDHIIVSANPCVLIARTLLAGAWVWAILVLYAWSAKRWGIRV